MYSIDIEGCPDAEIDFAIGLLSSERKRRETERARVAKSDLSRKGKRDPRRPRCGTRLRLDGSRHNGARSLECPICGAKATHDGSPSHNQMIKGNRLTDDWRKFVKGDKGCESAMKRMSNCCSYLRHAFESHNGIKYTKLGPMGVGSCIAGCTGENPVWRRR